MLDLLAIINLNLTPEVTDHLACLVLGLNSSFPLSMRLSWQTKGGIFHRLQLKLLNHFLISKFIACSLMTYDALHTKCNKSVTNKN